MDECGIETFEEAYKLYGERRIYALSDLEAAEELGVLKLRRQPYLNLTGRNIILGIADTGIDYTHPVFRFPDGRSRVGAVWDQTAEGASVQEGVPYGVVYSREEINAALEMETPLAAVPVTDPLGHGTFMAGLAAGNEMPGEDFTGIAVNGEILVVKLRQAEECLKKFWFVDEETPAYAEEDLIEAVNFMISYAQKAGKEMVLCLGMSSNQGNHQGIGRFESYLNLISLQPGRAVVLSGGNEGNRQRHFRGRSYEGIVSQDIEIRVADVKDGLFVEFWADAPDRYGIGFVSPGGEVVEKLPSRTSFRETIPFVFEPTIIYVVYERVEPVTGQTCIRIFMKQPVDGIWKLRIYQEEVFGGRFDLWMPVGPFVQGDAVFLKPDPETTITDPGNGVQAMTITAYSGETGGIALDSSRGFSLDGMVKPDFVAPGMNIRGPVKGGLYAERSGSSVAAALGAGVAALLLEYDREYTGVQIKNYLIRGAVRDDRGYPNTEFGWGKLNIYEALENMRA